MHIPKHHGMNTTCDRYEDAERFSSSSLSLDDSNIEAYLIRACAKNKLGKLEDAIEGQCHHKVWLIGAHSLISAYF